MSRRRGPARTQARPWLTMTPATKVPLTEEQLANRLDNVAELGFDRDRIEELLRRDVEMWRNDRYVCVVTRDSTGGITVLSIRRDDRKPDIPWRHLQAIKNDIAGPDVEALELFPAESRLVDTANQRWLWCWPKGEQVPIGFNEGRHVAGPEEAAAFGARQS